MKRSLILLFAVLMAAVAPLVPARAQSGGDALPIEFVYDALGPYGDWIYTPNYGYVWQPLASQQQGWSPYADGSWAFTDAGWTWISNEDFGWLTYHYGRWIRLMGSWMWVPGNEWAPAWVSWRQTQGQIGWAPLPPEAMWSPNVGFGGWTDSYYDVGPAYYNFVPVGLFASSGSMLPCILDRSRNFTYYDQSVNVTHTVFQQNVMNHIFVGGPDPQRINAMGGNQVRRLTLRHDDEGFRRNWMDRPNGGPPRGAGGPWRIDRDRGQLVVAAPSFRRDASHALPSRVRESFEKPVMDRGWQGGADAQRLRQKQRDDLERTRPAILPEKRVLPATSTVPPPATGRVLNAEERRGRGGNAPGGTMPPNADHRLRKDDERQPMTPKNPLPPGGPPGVPPRTPTVPGAGTVPPAGRPRSNERPGMKPDETPGRRPGERNSPAPDGAGRGERPGMPQTPQTPQTPQAPQLPKRREPQTPPPVVVPVPGQPPGAGRQPGFPGRRPAQQPGNAPPQQQRPQQPPSAPVAPPRVVPMPVPMPVPTPMPQQPPRQRPQQPQPPAAPGAPQEPGGRRRR